MVCNAVISSLAIISLRKRERVGCFTLIVLWLSVFCVSSSRCHGLVHTLYWDISWSYASLLWAVFYVTTQLLEFIGLFLFYNTAIRIYWAVFLS